MKICLACEKVFSSPEWRCPACGHVPESTGRFVSFAPDLAGQSDTVDATSVHRLAASEAGHFWFRSRNRLLIWVLKKYFPKAKSFLEVGCGTGFVLSGIGEAFPHLSLSGSEMYSAGLAYAAQRIGQADLFQMDARRIPFDGEFDVIGAFDVLEHIEEDEHVLSQMHRALRSGGGIVLTVPQHPMLWSYVDEFSRHQRRYTFSELHAKVRRAGFRIERATSFVSLLLPLVMASRWKRGRRSAGFDSCAEYKLGGLVHWILENVLGVERTLIRAGVSFPAGASLLMVARKIR